MKFTFTLFLIGFMNMMLAQDCEFKRDTIFVPKEKKTLQSEVLEATLRNGSVVQLIKAPNGKLYMKLIVTENLYFDKIDQLEVKSGSKSFYVKDAKHYQYTKHKGYYFFEIYKNYVVTLKDNGLTGILFGKAETEFTRSDSNLIKKTAACFYESLAEKK